MRYRKPILLCGLVSLMMLMLCSLAFADKSAVSIQTPSQVSRGSEIVIRVTATHSTNNPVHYTEWLYVMVNGKEAARWDYTAFKRPEAETFTKEIKYTVTDNLEIKAEASCNIHGSAGPAMAKISVKD